MALEKGTTRQLQKEGKVASQTLNEGAISLKGIACGPGRQNDKFGASSAERQPKFSL
jgi:hypothetical protein